MRYTLRGMEDVGELKKELYRKDLEIEELEKLVAIDPLTKLLNRRGFLELAHKLFDEIRFSGEHPGRREHFVIDSFSVLFLDIDNFKKLNDSYGHGVGDKVLQFVSTVVKEKMRSSDFVGRWGGEEIVVALIGASEGDAYIKAEEIRRAIKSRVKIPTLPNLVVTVSMGIAGLEEKVGLEDLIKRADQAMYQAKQSGKDRVVKFSKLDSK